MRLNGGQREGRGADEVFYETNVPGAVEGRDGVAVGTSMLKESQDIVTSDDTSGNKIVESGHG